MNALRSITGKILTLSLWLSALILGSSVLIYAANSILRSFKMAMPWPEEYCTYIVVVMVFLLQGKLEFDGDALTIDILEGAAKRSLFFRRLLHLIRLVVTAGVGIVLFRTGVSVASQNFSYGSVSPVMNISMGIYFSIINVCFVLLIITSVVCFILRLCEKEEQHA